MALKVNKTEVAQVKKFDDFSQAKKVFEDDSLEVDERIEAVDYILAHKDMSDVLKMLREISSQNDSGVHPIIDYAFANFHRMIQKDTDFDEMFLMLKSDNAYLRNMAITFLQNSGEDSIQFLEKLLENKDKDIRIFAINVLGDVKYDKSVDILRYFLAQEDDINAMMTAVDYMGEIGSQEDIPLLETLKVAHKDDPYVCFGVDSTIARIKG